MWGNDRIELIKMSKFAQTGTINRFIKNYIGVAKI
jgi:hypothetical protein